jgi:transglycosylase-like protein with SLT domain
MTRRRTGSIAAVLASVVIGLPMAFVLLLSGDGPCALAGQAPAPGAAAKNGIPSNYLELYQAAGQQLGVPWTLLAGIGSIETDHGRSSAAGVRSGVNFAGCCAGPMQFSIIGAAGGTWGAYGVDGDHDGRKDVYDPRDAIPGAANYLKASGAPGDLHRAIFAYNHSEAYVQQVLAKMREYASSTPAIASPIGPPDRAAQDASDAAPSGNCDDLGGLTSGSGGPFTLSPNANLPGRPLTPAMKAFIRRMATFYSGTLVVTTGTNHDKHTLNGNISDHFTGNAADFGMVLNHGVDDGPVGDAIAASAFLAAGLPRDEARRRARAGGTHTILSNGLRIQIIWKIDAPGIGNHHNHVHVGVGPVG